MEKPKLLNIRQSIGWLLTSIFIMTLLSGCSDFHISEKKGNNDSKIIPNHPFVKSTATQPYLSGVENVWCRQDSGNCGPTTFYMIFKYMGDYQMPNTFYDGSVELVGSQYDLRIDVNFLDGYSPFNYWLECTNPYYTGGLNQNTFSSKLFALNYNGEQYYNILKYETSTTSTSIKDTQFALLQQYFLNEGVPVMIHLERLNSAGHIIIVVGCDGNTVYYMDPYLGKYSFDNKPITNNIPDDPILTVSYMDFIQNSWYDNSFSSDNAYWDGIWFGCYHDLTPAEPDVTAPDQVLNVTASVQSSSSIKLTWNSNNEPDLKKYNIYRDGINISQSITNTFIDSGLIANTTYSYQVSAVDKTGNEGLKSVIVSATTNATIRNILHVNSIDIIKKNRVNWLGYTDGYYIYTIVDVRDGLNVTVSGVTVSIKLISPNGLEYSARAVSSFNGSAKIYVEVPKMHGNYSSTVISLLLSNYEYLPINNIVESASITITNSEESPENNIPPLYLPVGVIGGISLLVITTILKRKRRLLA